METFALVTTILSMLLIASFVALSVRKFGMKRSYSAFAPYWSEAVPIKNINLWSVVTVITAFLFAPGSIERGAGNNLQFLGFFMSVFLIVVACAPLCAPKPEASEEEIKRKNAMLIVHIVAAILCAIAVVLWTIFVCHRWWLYPLAFAMMAFIGFASKTLKTSFTFWAEMALFVSGYAGIMIGG